MEINVKDPQVFFAAFYIISFLVISALAVFFSKTRILPLASVLLLLTFTTFITITGSRIFTIPVTEWWNLLISGNTELHPGRSAIGGLLFGLAGFLFSVKILGLGKQALQIYAWVTPLALGIQKMGCFLNGCCYGITTESVLGIYYPKGTSAHFDHLLNGIIGNEALISHKVIPVQIIEMFVYLTIAYVVWRTRGVWKSNLSIIFFTLLLIFISRFNLEFLRDPLSSPFRNTAFGIKYFQWFLLVSGIVCSFLLNISECYVNNKEGSFWHKSAPSLKISVIYISLISTFIFAFRGLFTYYEKASIYIILIPSILLTAYQFYLSLPRLRISILTTSLLMLPFFMIYPTVNSDTAGTKKPKKIYYQHDVKKYQRIDAGSSFGKYYNTSFYNPHEGECGNSYTTEDYEHVFTMFGGGYSVVNNNETSIITKGINIYGGTNDEHNLTTHEFSHYFIGGINPYIRFDSKWVGAGFGLHAGKLRWVIQKESDEIKVEGDTRSSPVLPEVEFRLGRKDILDVRYSYGMNSYATFPIIINELSLGTGFGFKTDFSFRYGGTISSINSYQFLSGEWVIGKKIGMNLKYHFGSQSNYYGTGTYYSSDTYKSKGILILGANYRFGFEK